MPFFDYKARTQSGEIIDERLEAPSKIEAIVEIQSKSMTVISIEEVKKDISLFKKNKVSSKELALFCKQLGQLIETGVSIHRGIELISEQIKNKFFQEEINDVVREIKSGTSLSRSLEKHPKVFSEMMTHQMKAAEDGGFLAETLKSLAHEFERDASFKKQIRSAFMYPSFVVLASVGMMWFMMALIVPTLSKTLENFDTPLPNITKTVIALSKVFTNYWHIGLVSIIGAVVAIVFILKQPGYRLYFDRMLMKTPLIGKFVATLNISRVARIMSSLMGSGVVIDQTLTNVGRILNNLAMKEAMAGVKDEVVNRGTSLHKAVEKFDYFPKTFVQIIQIGEEAGNLSEVLAQLADQYEVEVTDSLKALTSAINPILMIFIGLIVGTVILSMFLPMFSLMGNI